METKKDPRGRKPLQDKKKCIRLYLYDSTVNKLGGEDVLKARIYGYLERRAGKNAV